MKADEDPVSLQPRRVLARGSFARLISIAKIVDGVVSGWTIYNTSTDFCTISFVSLLYKRLTISRFPGRMCLVTSFMVVIWVKQPFCVTDRLASFVVHG